MTFVLTRVDYASVGVTARGTTRIFPATEPKVPQRFAVADQDGVLYIFGLKRGEFQVLFKSLPGAPVNRLVLGGTVSAPKDKIFLAQGNTVTGYTKKGKLFLEFDTSLLDTITAMYVLGSDLAACARDVYHRYRDCKDADSYLAGEKLYDVVLLPVGSVVAVLACGDCAIRVLYGTRSPAVLRLPSVPTTLTPYREAELDSTDRVLVGTMDGKVGLLMLDSDKSLRVSWILNRASSEVTSMDTFELQDGVDLIVGRQDGTVDVYTLPEDEDVEPMLRFHYNAGESISTVVGGFVGSGEYSELLVTTYSGKVFGLTTKPAGLIEAAGGEGNVARLREEIQQLEAELKKEFPSSMGLGNQDSLAPVVMSVNHRLTLNKEGASYLFTVELDRSIDNVLIQSDTPIELLDVEGNNAVMSLSTCDPNEGNFVLATYRCQDNTNRLEIKLRSIEGQPGTLQVYITSQIQPKCCRRILVPICALSLHARLHVDDKESIVGGPFNELRLTGSFSMAEMHAWLALALPDVPERPSVREEETEASMIYTSTFIGTVLKCRYKKSSATFLSENISTIIILRDLLTKEATKRKIKLDVFCDVAEASVSRVLELVMPRLKEVSELTEKIKILDALETWEMKSNPSELCSEYQELVRCESELREKMLMNSNALQRLHAAVTDLYVDWERAKNSRRISSKQAALKLQGALDLMDATMLLGAFTITDSSMAPTVSVPALLQ
ncbi:Bardet-Biedl syndrome 7 protein homolog [Copidosoma floridanum]|uniref:Bardet-Biedl syndrome 7 protein homolog n=1 Tax=Copidosoma floridanum TaxID=29053 RepID=UPI0006C949B5|nr:Bardet-Biedl syndrome 7 protein homolog [Copidosoma floridanum]